MSDASALYVSGPPGCGKTALLQSIINGFVKRLADVGATVNVQMVNCSSLPGDHKSDTQFWEALSSCLRGNKVESAATPTLSKQTGRACFERNLADAGRTLLVLDEIDQLEDVKGTTANESSALAQLFAYASRDDSQLSLIGIANSLDLTARFGFGSPASTFIKAVQQVHFKAYAGAEVEAILRERLVMVHGPYPRSKSSTQTAVATPSLFSPPALKLCSMKIAASSGDLRAAFSLARAVVSRLEKDAIARSPDARLESYDGDNAPRAGPQLVSSVFAAAGYGPTAAQKAISDINANARLVLVCICVALARACPSKFATKKTDVATDVDEAYRAYQTSLKEESTLKPVALSEYLSLMDVLEGVGLVRAASGNRTSKSNRGRKDRRASSTASKSIVLAMFGLDELIEALNSNTGWDASGTTSQAASIECARICRAIVHAAEQRFLRGKSRDGRPQEQQDAEAPREGFSGRGLDEERAGGAWLGKRVSTAA